MGAGISTTLNVPSDGLNETMDFRVDMVDGLSPSQARTLLPRFMAGFMELNAQDLEQAISELTASIEDSDDAAVMKSLDYLRRIGEEYRLYRADPVAQRLTRAHMRFLMSESSLEGVEHLRMASDGGPTLLLSNHLSYCDTQLKDVLLHDNGASDLASKMIVVAGPKVYENAFRRMASMGLNTLQTAQSAGIQHNQGSLSAREVAAIALGTVRNAHQQMLDGGLVLIYGEGTRSRTGKMAPFLKAVRKYLQLDGCRVVPVAITGSQQMMPIEGRKMRRSAVQMRIGQPIEVQGLGPLAALETSWHAIAEMLPIEYRPSATDNAVI